MADDIMLHGTSVIIIAGGEQTRWKSHMGRSKHLIEVNGETLLRRSTRLARQFNPRGEVTVSIICKPGDEAAYKTEGADIVVPEFNHDNFDADKFLNSKMLWRSPGRTVVLYGDVFFTEDAMRRIMQHETDEWVLWARPFASNYTGTQWGECFAQTFWWDNLLEHDAALRRIVELYRVGKLHRCGGWEHYRAMLGLPDWMMNKHIFGSRLQVIDDFTEDFDYPYDYDRWLERYKEAHNVQ